MRISIDATGLGGTKTGTGVYVTEILQQWNQRRDIAHEFVIFASPKAASYLGTLGLDARFHFVEAPNSRAVRIGWQQTMLPWHLVRLGIDVHWGCGFVLPLIGATPSVVTIYDLTFQLFPAVHERIKRHYFPAMMAAAVKKARRVIAISETTRHDLYRLLPASEGKTDVTLLAPRTLPGGNAQSQHMPAALRGCEGYVVCLGTVEPRKNLRRLLEAWRTIRPADRQGIKMAVVGMHGWMLEQTKCRADEEDDSIVFLGFLDDEALHGVMRGATALAYPSLYEGFGLPVVEAMSLGVPVLTSDVGATKEVSGGCAILTNPDDVEAIRHGLLQLLRNNALRERLAALGTAHAARYSWRHTAEQTLQILERAAGSGQARK